MTAQIPRMHRPAAGRERDRQIGEVARMGRLRVAQTDDRSVGTARPDPMQKGHAVMRGQMADRPLGAATGCIGAVHSRNLLSIAPSSALHGR